MSGRKLSPPNDDAPWPRHDDGTPVPIEVLDEEVRDEWAEHGEDIEVDSSDFDDDYYDPHAS